MIDEEILMSVIKMLDVPVFLKYKKKSFAPTGLTFSKGIDQTVPACKFSCLSSG